VVAGCPPTADPDAQALPQAPPSDPIDALRSAAAAEDADGRPLGETVGVDPSRPVGKGNPPRQKRRAIPAPRPSRLEIERHQAEQIFALNECARRAMDAEQFSAAVGAFRVIAEIGGLLRAPIKPPEPRA
jgi:hypothetical protein